MTQKPYIKDKFMNPVNKKGNSHKNDNYSRDFKNRERSQSIAPTKSKQLEIADPTKPVSILNDCYCDLNSAKQDHKIRITEHANSKSKMDSSKLLEQNIPTLQDDGISMQSQRNLEQKDRMSSIENVNYSDLPRRNIDTRGRSQSMAPTASKPSLVTDLTKPVSLRNSGATCYLNSALQGISSCFTFVSALRQLQLEHEQLPKLRLFNGLVTELITGKAGYLKVSSHSIFRDWNKPGQQDSYELLAYVLNQVYSELRIDMESRREIEKRNLQQWLQVKLPMRILMIFRITCECGAKSSSPLQSDLAFHVSISNTKDNLQCLFDRYFDEDPIEDYECDSSTCKHTRATRIARLCNPVPDTICIHLQRTFWNTSKMKKIQHKIDFNEHIFIKKKFIEKSFGQDRKYSLVSVIVHSGTVYFGHYICYKCINGTWFYTSDSTVYKVSWEEVCSRQAYILFYEVEKIEAL